MIAGRFLFYLRGIPPVPLILNCSVMKHILIVMLTAGLLSQCKDAPRSQSQDLPDSQPEMAESATALNRETARAIAMQTQAALGGTLKQQIAENGAVTAIAFCNVQALPITDSLATLHKVQIARITDRARNPINRASPEEVNIMEGMRQLLKQAEGDPVPAMADSLGTHTYYFPIVTNALCINCHGRPETDMDPAVLGEIRLRYPADSALGYGAGQLRGLWKVATTQANNP